MSVVDSGSFTGRVFLLLVTGVVYAGSTVVAAADTSSEPLPARVGVFADPAWAGIGVNECLPAPVCVRVLTRYLPTDVFTAADLADPAVLDARRVPLLVMPSGNAFPEAALNTLRRYRRAGGSLITFGEPFHQAVTVHGAGQGRTVETRHIKDIWAHVDDGLATGGLLGPLPATATAVRTVPANPLGFAQGMLGSSYAHQRRLEVKTFPAGDEVIPLVTITDGTAASLPVAAAIRHGCPHCPGGRDVWIGHTAWSRDPRARYAGEQLLARAALWSLHERGCLDAAEFAERLAAVDALLRPDVPPAAKHDAQQRPRSWGKTFLPKSAPPARVPWKVTLAGLPADERIAVTCLQALLAREQPRLFLVRHEPDDALWLEQYVAQGHVERFEPVADWTTLLDRHRSLVRGAVIPDPGLFRGDVLALNVAACEDCLVTTPELATRLGLPVKADLRGRFTTYAEGLAWLWETYHARLNPHLCDLRHPRLLPFATFDHAFQWRGLMFWVAGPREEHEPGADAVAELAVVARILADMPANGVCLGFPALGDGEGMGEPRGVELLSRYGISHIPTNHGGNYSFSSGVRIDRLEQPTPVPSPVLDRSKVYIALALSDGDNQVLWPKFYRRYFEHPAFGTFPLAFGIGPTIRELQPAVAQWYFEKASPTTEFFADVSGAGYMNPDHFAEACVDRPAVWADFFNWTRRLMEPLGLRTIRTVNGMDDAIAKYAEALPTCHSILADMGRYSGREGIANLTYSLPSGMPVFRSVTSWRYGTEGFLREVREQVGDVRPAFVNGFVHCWTFDMDSLAKIYADRDADTVFVTPSQLAALYRQANREGPAPAAAPLGPPTPP